MRTASPTGPRGHADGSTIGGQPRLSAVCSWWSSPRLASGCWCGWFEHGPARQRRSRIRCLRGRGSRLPSVYRSRIRIDPADVDGAVLRLHELRMHVERNPRAGGRSSIAPAPRLDRVSEAARRQTLAPVRRTECRSAPHSTHGRQAVPRMCRVPPADGYSGPSGVRVRFTPSRPASP